jgi:hypothetical protein
MSEHDNKEGVASENKTTDEKDFSWSFRARLVRWAESQGYTVRITNSDLKGKLLPGHPDDDEAAPTETV